MGQCRVEGCERPVRSRHAELCNTHYFRVRRTGDVGTAEIAPYRTPGCDVEGCDKPHDAKGLCTVHLTRFKRHGDVNYVGRPKPRWGPDNASWQGDEVGYGTAHDRVRRRRGPASKCECHSCDGRAAHWAYDHADPNERVEEGLGPYSPDPAHYFPMCVPCHKRFDLSMSVV